MMSGNLAPWVEEKIFRWLVISAPAEAGLALAVFSLPTLAKIYGFKRRMSLVRGTDIR